MGEFEIIRWQDNIARYSMSKSTKAMVTGGIAAGGVAGGATALVAGQAATALAIPSLMSTFSVVTSGVGSTMPLWLPAIQSFSAVTAGAAAISPLGLAVIGTGVVVGGVVAGGSVTAVVLK